MQPRVLVHLVIAELLAGGKVDRNHARCTLVGVQHLRLTRFDCERCEVPDVHMCERYGWAGPPVGGASAGGGGSAAAGSVGVGVGAGPAPGAPGSFRASAESLALSARLSSLPMMSFTSLRSSLAASAPPRLVNMSLALSVRLFRSTTAPLAGLRVDDSRLREGLQRGAGGPDRLRDVGPPGNGQREGAERLLGATVRRGIDRFEVGPMVGKGLARALHVRLGGRALGRRGDAAARDGLAVLDRQQLDAVERLGRRRTRRRDALRMARRAAA